LGKGLGFHSLEFSRDGRRLLSAGQDKTAKLWDLGPSGAAGRLERSDTLGPSGTAGGAEGSDTIHSGKPLLSIEGHQAEVLAARFSHDGTRFVTAGADGVANVWDASSGDLLLSFASPLALNWADFSPDDTQLVVAGDDQFARIWTVAPETRSGDEIARFARCNTPFRLDGARMSRVTIDRAACKREPTR
jgi:WD40 repeat protein